jgi:Kef-type K+ transport system membrane component KefB
MGHSSRYGLSEPLIGNMRLLVLPTVLIIAFTQLLGLILGRIRQPHVIAETIGGVLLGPSVLGRIPGVHYFLDKTIYVHLRHLLTGFTAAIFPDASIPLLRLTSTIGLVIFLFLVGLEIDVRIIKRNIKASIAIFAAGLLVPLGLGAALGVGIYRQFVHPSVNFGYFVLFSAVAVGITAFPVLCRILTETKLVDTTVGVVTLSAGIGNDVVSWILLALAVALVNAGNGIIALYVLFTSAGFVLFMLYPVRCVYGRLATRTGCLETGQPSQTMMTLTLLIVFVAAFFTDVIGVHPIFGACVTCVQTFLLLLLLLANTISKGGFLAGLIIPHQNGYAITVVEKLEDLVSIIFLPLVSWFH